MLNMVDIQAIHSWLVDGLYVVMMKKQWLSKYVYALTIYFLGLWSYCLRRRIRMQNVVIFNISFEFYAKSIAINSTMYISIIVQIINQ